jgi:hypothetical protein
MSKKKRLPAMWVKARREVIAAVASDRIRAGFRPMAPYCIDSLEKTIEDQNIATAEFIDEDVNVAMDAFKELPFTMPHHALISAAAHRAYQRGQVSDPNIAYTMMRKVLDRYFQARS